MKYVCEKCGKKFNSWEECYACETDGHASGFDWTLDDETKKRWQYQPGHYEPERIVMCVSRDNPDGETERKFCVYEMVGIAPDTAEIMAEYEKRKAAEDAYWEEYKAKREAAKAAMEQESA